MGAARRGSVSRAGTSAAQDLGWAAGSLGHSCRGTQCRTGVFRESLAGDTLPAGPSGQLPGHRTEEQSLGTWASPWRWHFLLPSGVGLAPPRACVPGDGLGPLLGCGASTGRLAAESDTAALREASGESPSTAPHGHRGHAGEVLASRHGWAGSGDLGAGRFMCNRNCFLQKTAAASRGRGSSRGQESGCVQGRGPAARLAGPSPSPPAPQKRWKENVGR